jgi:chromosome segregation ATPase
MLMENNKRTRRSASEIIAETEARLSRLRMREAKERAQTDPQIASLLDQKEDLVKSLREAKKVLGTGPQSAQARLEKHQLWIEKIEAAKEDAEDLLSSVQPQIDDIDQQIASAIDNFIEKEAN